MKTYRKGFSLIELMIVIAIIGILAAIAIPSYKNYVLKSKMAEQLVLIDAMKLRLEDYLESTGDLAACSDVNFGFNDWTINSGGVPSGIEYGYTHGSGFLGAQPDQCIAYAGDFNFNGGSFLLNFYSTFDQNGGISWNCGYLYTQGGTTAEAPFAPKDCARLL